MSKFERRGEFRQSCCLTNACGSDQRDRQRSAIRTCWCNGCIGSGNECSESAQHGAVHHRFIIQLRRAEFLTNLPDNLIGNLLRKILAQQCEIHVKELGGHARDRPSRCSSLVLQYLPDHLLDGCQLTLRRRQVQT